MHCLDLGYESFRISFQDDGHHLDLVNNLHPLGKLLHMGHLVEPTFKENMTFFEHPCNRLRSAADIVAMCDNTNIVAEAGVSVKSNSSLNGSLPVNEVQRVCLNRIDKKIPCESTTASSKSNFLTEDERSNAYLDDGAQGDYIPNNYEEEMEECSEYIFSDQPYCPRISQSNLSDSADSTAIDGIERSKQHGHTKHSNVVSTHYQACGTSSSLERRSSEYQKLANSRYHWIRNWVWAQNMQSQVSLTDEQSQHSLRALLREACRRDMLRLRAMPAERFLRTLHPTTARGSATLLPSIDSSSYTPAECKAFYLHQIHEKWRALAKTINDEIEKGTPIRSLLSLLSAQSLFGSDLTHIIRELEPCLAEELKQQRRARAARLIRRLAANGQLFVPPPVSGEREKANEREKGREGAREKEGESEGRATQPPSPTWSGCETVDDDTPAISSDDDGGEDEDEPHSTPISLHIPHDQRLPLM